MEPHQIKQLLGDDEHIGSILSMAAGPRPTDEAAAKQYDAAKEIADAYQDVSDKGLLARLRVAKRVGGMLEAYATVYGEPRFS